MTAAGVRCALNDGHLEAHDTTYIFPPLDFLPERPEPNDDPLPEDLERLLRDPEISLPGDYAMHFWLADYLRRDPEATPTREAYLSLWALYEKESDRGID